MKFSIIIPVYNIEKYLSACLESILSQEFKDYEIIIIDDGSTDNSFKICENYAKKDARIKVEHQKNAGVGKARNKGIKMAQAEYLLFLDGDDVLVQNSLYNINNCMKTADNSDIIFCNYHKENSDGKIIDYNYSFLKEKINNYSDSMNLIDEIIKYGILSSSCNKLYRTNFIKNNKVFFNDFIYAEDFNWCLNLILMNPKCFYCNEYLFIYKYRNESITKSVNLKKELDRMQFCLKWYEKLNKTNNIINYLSDLYLRIVNDYIYFDRKARKIIKKAFNINEELIKLSRSYRVRFLVVSIKFFGLFFTSLMKKMRLVLLKR